MSHASQEQFLAAIIVPTVGPSLFVAIRLVNNYGLRKRFLADDCELCYCYSILVEVTRFREVVGWLQVVFSPGMV